MSYSEGLQEITEDNENIVLESFKLLQLRTVENERNNNIFSEEEQRNEVLLRKSKKIAKKCNDLYSFEVSHEETQEAIKKKKYKQKREGQKNSPEHTLEINCANTYRVSDDFLNAQVRSIKKPRKYDCSDYTESPPGNEEDRIRDKLNVLSMADTESSTQNQRKDFCQEFNALSIEERKNNTKNQKKSCRRIPFKSFLKKKRQINAKVKVK